jgi:protein translocase SecG subunit
MNIIVLIQAVLAVLLSLAILLQHRASGLSATFGGQSDTSYVQRRGAERVLYQGTIVIAIAFFILTFVDWFI